VAGVSRVIRDTAWLLSLALSRTQTRLLYARLPLVGGALVVGDEKNAFAFCVKDNGSESSGNTD